MERNALYAEVHEKRDVRMARRAERIERERRIRKVTQGLQVTFEAMLVLLLAYMYFLLGLAA